MNKAEKTLQKALAELEQEAASIQVLGRALTKDEKVRLKALKRAVGLTSGALDAIR